MLAYCWSELSYHVYFQSLVFYSHIKLKKKKKKSSNMFFTYHFPSHPSI